MKNSQGRKKMLTLLGKGVSLGMAQGKAFVYKDVLLFNAERMFSGFSEPIPF
jgi:hypothetical protein